MVGQCLGKHKTIVVFAGIYIVGLLILLLTLLPVAINNGAGFGGFIAAILIIGLELVVSRPMSTH